MNAEHRKREAAVPRGLIPFLMAIASIVGKIKFLAEYFAGRVSPGWPRITEDSKPREERWVPFRGTREWLGSNTP